MKDCACVHTDLDPMKVNLTYFKRSGKYYTTGDYETRMQYIHQIFEEVHRKRDSGQPMPGLIGTWNEGAILIDVPDHEHNHPHLVMPH